MSNTDQESIRLLLIDDHTLFRESVARLLQAEPGFEVVAHCSSGSEALQIVKSAGEIDVVLLDLDL
ncbi:MAG: response regulator, partial [Candidatus Acidiferrum sp.]